MTAINQFAAHVGLDWADKKHNVCVQFKNGERIFQVVEHTPEALDIWLNELHQKVKGRIAIALELKKGPVVLYFFPAAFTKGCTLEAHAFAEATDDFKKLGATVVGVTAGNVDQVDEFSKLECRDKFAVAADPGAKVAAEYQTLMQMNGKTVSDRTSFVIAPDGKILLSYTDRNPDEHIQKTMDAVKKYAKSHS